MKTVRQEINQIVVSHHTWSVSLISSLSPLCNFALQRFVFSYAHQLTHKLKDNAPLLDGLRFASSTYAISLTPQLSSPLVRELWCALELSDSLVRKICNVEQIAERENDICDGDKNQHYSYVYVAAHKKFYHKQFVESSHSFFSYQDGAEIVEIKYPLAYHAYLDEPRTQSPLVIHPAHLKLSSKCRLAS